MSTVLITDYTENIKNLIPKTVEVQIKSPRYRSKYNKKSPSAGKEATRPASQTDAQKTIHNEESKDNIKSSHRTFGVACVHLNSPSEFLKKGSRITPPRPNINHVHPKRPGNYQRALPAWTPIKRPAKKDIPDLPKDPVLTERKNFRLQNILNAKKSKPRKPVKRFVDTRYGSSHDLERSGLLPVHISRKGYGKIPKFLSQNYQAKVQATEDDENIEIRIQPRCDYITADEREKLLQGMKQRWDEMTKQFQCLPFLTDTPPKAKRKAKMEEDLKQLEKDIDIIERHPHIYVYSDDEDD